MNSYSRAANISFVVESLKQLRELSEELPQLDNRAEFVVRLKMMENLARLAFNYSLKVNYLNEKTEYMRMAELLDDTILQLSRGFSHYMAMNYGHLVVREYDLMREAIDLMDERLKTIRVFCYGRRIRNRRNRNVRRRWVDENGYRMRTPYREEQEEAEEPNTFPEEQKAKCACSIRKWFDCTVCDRQEDEDDQKDEDYTIEVIEDLVVEEGEIVEDLVSKHKCACSVRKWFDCTVCDDVSAVHTVYASDMKPVQTKCDDVSAVHTVYAAEANPDQTKCNELKNELMNRIRSIQVVSGYAFMDKVGRFFEQCYAIKDMFALLENNAKLLATEHSFRKQVEANRGSLMQICISKCTKMVNDLESIYEKFDVPEKQKTLKIKSETIEYIKYVKDILCKYYIQNPIEPEEVDYVCSGIM
jgi:hypothetical protein